ncbi:glycosyl hydrolase family 88 [Edwardsiella hoshinae]|uniref:Glycosyl hydrolase family 88 n=1 Tax=Edwardsiella hoshinae TaxID=93378 RepID=A0A376DAI4_9GAMM|nr:glycoside hydrolase family 88 protein [Edwardsiella hoshinae]AOV96310.1 glycosyl hydrolase family 88 [Edwardsiella hoshinae]QPR27809.1 glycoside hydrolase family 88 protein [Edwardsiella hoshinae]STC85931.1 Unsaturated rhamnogalacturonyl hydrolase YteR [Edwardsiella hoshinae]
MSAITREEILADMLRVYRYQAANQTRSVVRRSGKTRFIKDTDWERGVFWSCVAAAWQATGDNIYLDGVMNYTLHTGFRTGPNARFADDMVCCQAYLDVYPQVEQPEALEPTIKALSQMVDEPRPGREDWWWCDALFMAPPAFAALSARTGDSRYVDYMDVAFWDAVEHLYDPESGLFYRDYRYIPDGQGGELREENGEKVFWSRGNGWVLAAVPRILAHLPAHHPSRARYLALFSDLAAAVSDYQQADGLWRTSMRDPARFPAAESSAAALFCYGLAWGIAQGLLARERYLPIVERAWTALQGCIQPNGMLGWVQLPAFNPRDVQREHNIDYGAGAYLLAGSAMLALYA